MINKLVQGFANMPGPMKVAAIVVAMLGVFAVILLFGGTTAIYVVIGGLLVVGLLIAGYQGVLTMLAKKRSAPLERSLSSNAAMAPQGISEPARRARLDDLRKSFEGGVEKFRAAGKNLYALPWYLLVGEPGSGKTEAIRHCNVGFPPGLQDQLQGAGGTLNMNWWFTNHAVILDTAGRLLFEEVEPGKSGEWQEFLKLLKRNRPNCPINGMLLVIPAESLVKDTSDAIEKKAGRIAEQLDAIQRAIGVRFPVFVLITKCDLINGFREFFDEITDPALQHQILGWSNHEPLDRPFNPERVEEHLATVEQRLARRRSGLLLDPVNTENPAKRRTDQVDALYAFPEALQKIAPRLKRYLEMIFVAGEWAQKPLFLRGIYFTSSMREGACLDQELADAFGVPVESLPEGKIWERDRAFFLRDLFMQKVFREKGLVTQAVSPNKQQNLRNLLVYGTAGIGLAAVGLLTWLGAAGMAKSIVGPSDFWNKTGKAYGDNSQPANAQFGTSEQSLPIVGRLKASDHQFKYFGGPGQDAEPLSEIPVIPEHRTRSGMAKELAESARAPIVVPTVFRPVAAVIGDTSESLAGEQRLAAARALFESSVLRPLIDACNVNLAFDSENGSLPPEATPAVTELKKLEAAANGDASAGLVNLEPLMRYALRGNDDFAKKNVAADLKVIDEAYKSLYADKGSWPPASLRGQKFVPEGVPSTAVANGPTPPPAPTTVNPKPAPPPKVPPVVEAPKPPTPSAPAALAFPLAPFASADAELTSESLAAARAAIAAGGAGLNAADRKRAESMLAALPTGRSTQICTLSVLPTEPPSLGKSSLVAAAPSVAIAAGGGEAGSPVALTGNEVRLTKLRAPGAAFELRFMDPAKPATPAATLAIPSHWGGMYLIDKFHGQPTHAGDRRVWDVEAEVPAGGATKSVWLRLEFDAELPELPWYP